MICDMSRIENEAHDPRISVAFFSLRENEHEIIVSVRAFIESDAFMNRSAG